MKNSTLITITTIDGGSKQYSISQLVRKFIIFIIIFGIFLMISTFVFINYLNGVIEKKNKEIEKNRLEMQEIIVQKDKLKHKILTLEQNISSLEKEISKKENLLTQINDKIEDIERIIQYKPPKNIDVTERLDLAKLNLIDKKFLLQYIPNGSPVPFKGISSPFGWRIHPIYHKKEFHPGLDLRAKTGTPVFAPANGVVEYAHFHKKSGYGKLLIIDHNFGFKTLYGHLSKLIVKQGEFVKKGQIVAYTGNTGLSNGPHLHYEVRYIGVVLNPLFFVKWNLKNYNTIFEKEKKVNWQGIVKEVQTEKSIFKLKVKNKETE